MRWQIWDVQVNTLLAEGAVSLDETCERLEELLTQTREHVEATGDTVEGMELEWEIRDVDCGRTVAGDSGAPVPWPD